MCPCADIVFCSEAAIDAAWGAFNDFDVRVLAAGFDIALVDEASLGATAVVLTAGAVPKDVTAFPVSITAVTDPALRLLLLGLGTLSITISFLFVPIFADGIGTTLASEWISPESAEVALFCLFKDS